MVRLVDPARLTLHESAALVPVMRSGEYEDLLRDVRRRGITTPLEVLGNVVLDGRHRLRAALELDLQKVPVVDAFLGDDTPVGYLIKSAVLRRHLTDDQRAVVAAQWARLHQRPRGGDRRSADAPGIKRADVGPFDSHPGRAAASRLMAVPASRVKKAACLLAAAPDLAAQVQAGALKLANAVRMVQREAQLSSVAATKLPDGVYRTIAVDPPWDYDDDRTRGAAHHHYPTMTVEQICALPIGQRAAASSHLYLWVTNPHLEAGFQVLRAWGFTYVTTLTWLKRRLGLGRYFRGATEHVLFATRGRLPLQDQGIRNWFEAERRAHSEKPEVFYELVEGASPGPYLEAFARKRRSGWTCWGAEVDSQPAAPRILAGVGPVNPEQLDWVAP